MNKLQGYWTKIRGKKDFYQIDRFNAIKNKINRSTDEQISEWVRYKTIVHGISEYRSAYWLFYNTSLIKI